MSSQQLKAELQIILDAYICDPLSTSTEMYDDINECITRSINAMENNIKKAKVVQSLILGQRPTDLDNTVTQEQVTQSKNIPNRY
jgi:hypothetical protein